ncbi:extracellular solute-binding protein [Clostridium sp.]|uniref:ABC transporter substrate-binding protein n=1 Tax=Clostridium sp. TaxID=1506 RepID=UPI00284FE5BA|nr:extracellular solute-binding protein [Clostridium sp.]MDR3597742.1 extracellular solute-binding protein [Clostridium sp.]
MKKSKLISILTTGILTVSLLAGCGSSGGSSTNDKGSSGKNVKITFLNTKGEIATQLEDATKAFTKENPNITVDIVQAGAGESPFQKVSSMYAAGNAPSLSMLDPNDIPKFADKFADLSSEKWVKDATEGTLDAAKIDGKQVGFPLAIEGYGLIYNKAVLDKASVDPASIKTTKDLEAAFQKIQGIGVSPMVLSPMDWSLGAHFLPIAYLDQSKDAGSADKFVQDIKAGKVDLSSNAVFNGVMTTFDVLKANNIDKAAPLAGTYEKAPEYLGTGKAAFWFMGNWAWPQIKEFDQANGQYGFIPVPVSNNADDYGNSQIYAGSSKFIGVDTKNNDADQQAAAKKFLEWLVYSDNGQDFLVNKANLIPAFSNIKLEIADPLGKSIKQYMQNKKVIAPMTTLPGDHWAQLGGAMQKYLDGKSDKAALATDIQNYWKNVK